MFVLVFTVLCYVCQYKQFPYGDHIHDVFIKKCPGQGGNGGGGGGDCANCGQVTNKLAKLGDAIAISKSDSLVPTSLLTDSLTH